MKCKAEAGVAGPIDVVLPIAHEDVPYPGDPRVTRFTFGPRPHGIRDLRITGWITVEFEIPEESRAKASFLAREYIDRIVDAASVIAGMDLPIIYWQMTSPQVARPMWISTTRKTSVDLLRLARRDLTERHYRALRHLRRGLAQTSPEKRFSSLMLALLILARFWKPDVEKRTRCTACGSKPMRCEQCGAESAAHGPGDKDYLLNLAEVLESCDTTTVTELWKLRNAVTAHGNESYTSEAALQLVEASMTTAELCYAALNAALPELDLSGPADAWFITDVFLLEDSIAFAHGQVTDIGIEQTGPEEWTATWPPQEKRSFVAAHPLTAIRQAKEYASKATRKPVKDLAPDTLRVDLVGQ